MNGYGDIDVESGGGGDYVKLVTGNPVTIHLLSREPKKSIVHWVNRKKETCLGNVCELCKDGNKAKVRWLSEVWDRKDQKLKKFEFGNMIAAQLKSIAELMAESQQTVHDVDIRIKTTGSGLETEYSVLHVPKSGEIPQEVSDKFLPF